MTIRLGVVMDPISNIKPWKDSTFAMLLEARRRGWQVLYMTPADLYIRDGRAFARASDLHVIDNNDHWYELSEVSDLDLTITPVMSDIPTVSACHGGVRMPQSYWDTQHDKLGVTLFCPLN